MILCIGTTPAVQRVMVFNRLQVDTVNRATLSLDGVAGKSINVAKVLKTLGGSPVATGFLGGVRGDAIKEALTALHIEAQFVPVSAPTRQCITVIDESGGTVTELVEESRPVETSDYGKLTEVIRKRIVGCRAAVMSGTITPGGPVTFYQVCTDLARRAGALSILDAQGPALTQALRARPGLVKPNRPELARTLGRELPTEPGVIAAMRELYERGAERVVVTAGAAATLAFDGRYVWKIQSPSIKAVNPIGSGDAFTAALTWSLGRGDDLGQACRWGAAAGAANALSLMPGELSLQEVERLGSEVTVDRLTAIGA